MKKKESNTKNNGISNDTNDFSGNLPYGDNAENFIIEMENKTKSDYINHAINHAINDKESEKDLDSKDSDSKDYDSKETKDTEKLYSNAKKKIKQEVIMNYIFPDKMETIKSLSVNNKFYSKLLQFIRIAKIIFSAILVPGLLLSDTKFPDKYLNYTAGIASFFVACFELGDKMIVKSNKKRSEKLETVLKSMGIKETIPDTTLDDPMVGNSSK
jgi:hypothetical protein